MGTCCCTAVLIQSQEEHHSSVQCHACRFGDRLVPKATYRPATKPQSRQGDAAPATSTSPCPHGRQLTIDRLLVHGVHEVPGVLDGVLEVPDGVGARALAPHPLLGALGLLLQLRQPALLRAARRGGRNQVRAAPRRSAGTGTSGQDAGRSCTFHPCGHPSLRCFSGCFSTLNTRV